MRICNDLPEHWLTGLTFKLVSRRPIELTPFLRSNPSPHSSRRYLFAFAAGGIAGDKSRAASNMFNMEQTQMCQRSFNVES